MMTGGLAIMDAAPTIALESWTLAPEAIRSWAATAVAGSEKTYARAWNLSRNSPAATTARKLEEQGCVTMVQRGRPGEMKDYVLQRIRPQRGSVGKPLKAKRPVLDGDMARVLRVIRICIRDKRLCPFNRELGKEAGVHNASYVIQKLVAAKIVTCVVLNAAIGTRQITIIETGEHTALPAGWIG